MHKLLARQLGKAKNASGEADLRALLELVSAAYEQSDSDRRRTDRSISLMIAELDRLNRGLEQLVQERTAALREREAELGAQNLRFDAALSHMSQALLMFDSSARLVICNQRYIEMYGLSPDMIKPGRTLRELLDYRTKSGTFSDDPDHYIERLQAAIARGKHQSFVSDLPDGRTIATSNHPMADGGWVATHEDITERRRAEQDRDRNREFLDLIIENVPVTLYAKDASNRRFVLVNRPARSFGEYRATKCLGRPLTMSSRRI